MRRAAKWPGENWSAAMPIAIGVRLFIEGNRFCYAWCERCPGTDAPCRRLCVSEAPMNLKVADRTKQPEKKHFWAILQDKLANFINYNKFNAEILKFLKKAGKTIY